MDSTDTDGLSEGGWMTAESEHGAFALAFGVLNFEDTEKQAVFVWERNNRLILKDIGRTYEAIIRVNSERVLFKSRAIVWAVNFYPTKPPELFETTYFLHENPRFFLIDYSISSDRSQSPTPPIPGKTQDTKNLRRVFEGVISVDIIVQRKSHTDTNITEDQLPSEGKEEKALIAASMQKQ
ncbi:hypothetical protein B0T10DRAFT_576572 [Thelonectria olida]|uniref:Uncharacterized protein n=1 Tax=Thelonectria olida TaxID=1576542 RepID=A0A9P8VZR1_9HYPO|nr:hypothetical protein B0T10DRAFT_576572 [Thelonectria olida]